VPASPAVDFELRRSTIEKGRTPMRSGIDTKNGSPPTGAWTHALLVRGSYGERRPATWVGPETKVRPRAKLARRAAIRVTRRFRAPPHRVFDAWLDPEVARQWLFATSSRPIAHVEIDSRVGGCFRFVDQRDGEMIEHIGEYVEIVPHRRLAFSLSMERRPHVITRVMVELVPVKKGCALTLTHENVPGDCISRTEGRWTDILYGLGVTLASGPAAFHDHQE
jgi:uncharacterized protein YndB with AHSA1/START domain